MKQSVIWEKTREDFQNLINECSSFREVLEKLGLSVVAGNYETLKRRIQKDNINITQINENRHKLRKIWKAKDKYPNEQVFVKGSTYNRGWIKKRIIEGGLISYICSKCSRGPEWMGEILVLVLDHKNGINNDHRLENLHFLCPNCNSQSSTFAGRNNKRDLPICPSCQSPFSGYGKKCKTCWYNNQPKKFTLSREELFQMINRDYLSLRAIGKLQGVSGCTVKKWCKKFNIPVC